MPRVSVDFYTVARKALLCVKVFNLVRFWIRETKASRRLFAEMQRRTNTNNVVEENYKREIALARQHGVPLAAPRLWQREMGFLDEGNRVSLREYTFPGRCMNCEQNNKSAAVCFWNRQTKNARTRKAYEKRLLDIVQLWSDASIGRARHPEEFQAASVRTFPDPDLIRTGLDSRVPKQHMLPTLSVQLFAPRFRALLPTGVFLDAVADRRENEAADAHATRSARVEVLRRRHSGRPATRWRVWCLLKDTRRRWGALKCGAASCAGSSCVACRRARRKAQVDFCRDLSARIKSHLQAMYKARRGPFRDLPRAAELRGAYADSRVRVERCVTQLNLLPKPLCKKVYRLE